MNRQSRAEDWWPSQLSDEERLKRALEQIERLRAELKFEQVIADIDRIADGLAQSGSVGIERNSGDDDGRRYLLRQPFGLSRQHVAMFDNHQSDRFNCVRGCAKLCVALPGGPRRERE